MNSKQSISEALKSGAAGSEMDVMLTKDSVLVLYHNQTLDKETSCSGQIRNLYWNDIQHCSYNLPILNPEPLLSIKELFKSIAEPEDYFFSFDCKLELIEDSIYLNSFAIALTRHIREYGLQNNCFVESFNTDFLKKINQLDSSIRIVVYTSEFETGLQISKELPLFGLSMDAKKISKEEINQAHQNHLRVSLFNLKSENDNISAIEKSPDYLQTDKLEFLVEALR